MQGAPKINDKFIINPITKRQILVNGPVYTSLLEKGYNLSNIKTFNRTHPRRAHELRHPMTNKEFKEIKSMPYSNKLEGEGRGIRTRGWDEIAPKLVSERRQLKKKCGDKCFLYPEHNAFPICPKCRNNKCKCEIDCRGVVTAKVRAGEWKYKSILNNANKINSQICNK